MKYSIVQDGVVVNVAIASAPMSSAWVESDEAGIGWVLVDGTLVDPSIQEIVNLGGGQIEPA